jgi:hypothetical protein
MSDFFTINWLPFMIGTVFGFLPARLFINCECRHLVLNEFMIRVLERPAEDRRGRRRWWKLPLLWIDPVRGFVSGYYLTQAFEVPPEATDAWARWTPVLLTWLLIMAVFYVQTLGREKTDESRSPSGFSCGFILPLLGPMTGIAAILLGVSSALAFRKYEAGYLIAGLAALALGAVFGAGIINAFLNMTIVIAPAFFAWWRTTHLVAPVRY